MTAVEALKGLQTFIEKEVASTFLLQKEGFTTEEPEYVHPYVSLITLPHKNFMPVNFQVPHILIGLETGNDAANEHALNIRLQFATFGGDIRFKESANIPDSSGYIDLLNLMERTKEKLINAAVIEKSGAVNKPFFYGIYDEQVTYPYWYGYMNFTMQIPVTTRQMKEFLPKEYTNFL